MKGSPSSSPRSYLFLAGFHWRVTSLLSMRWERSELSQLEPCRTVETGSSRHSRFFQGEKVPTHPFSPVPSSVNYGRSRDNRSEVKLTLSPFSLCSHLTPLFQWEGGNKATGASTKIVLSVASEVAFLWEATTKDPIWCLLPILLIIVYWFVGST